MSLAQEYMDIERDIYTLKSKKKDLDAQVKSLETAKTSVRDKIIEDFLDNGVCYDDLGLHVRKIAPKPIINDPDLIPDSFFKVKREIDKTKINAAFKLGQPVEGVTLDNGGYTVMFRPKGES